MSNTIKKRQKIEKQTLVEQLEKTPIVQIACERTSISRATYYRWRKEDKQFSNQADNAIQKGNEFISDMAESQLIQAIKEKNLTAIMFWLKHHHLQYASTLEIHGKIHSEEEPLTKEQQKLITRALQLAQFITGGNHETPINN